MTVESPQTVLSQWWALLKGASPVAGMLAVIASSKRDKQVPFSDPLPRRAHDWLMAETSIVPLIVLRVVFGLLMFVSTVRFVANGWVDAFYIEPQFHFTYWGFGWVQPLPAPWLYLVFVAIGGAALMIAAGAFYRFSTIAFFVLFTYIELLDKTYYLNHYYFVSLLSFLLIWLPLNRCFALDTWRHPCRTTLRVPNWMLVAVRLQLGLVYFFAGVAKLKADWLFAAMPLQIWLRANTDFPLIGHLFDYTRVAYSMSWAGMLYDLTIPFWLLYRRTRPVAYLVVIGFHIMTRMLFPIGMFPLIMIGCTVVFFSANELVALARTLNIAQWIGRLQYVSSSHRQRLSWPLSLGFVRIAVLSLFFATQLVMPLRHWFYPGNVLWTEEGYRFAWNVMLAEKTGQVTFFVEDSERGRIFPIYPSDYLSYQQEKQMAFQPDMILDFAHYLHGMMGARGINDVAVRVEAYVSLNGRPSQLLIDPTVDLAVEPQSLAAKQWILPLVDDR